MNGGDKKHGNFDLIFQAFANLLTKQAAEQNKRDERRADQTNAAINELTKSVNKLTINHIESQEAQKYANSRMDRYEVDQKEISVVLKKISNTVLTMEIAVKSNRGWIFEVTKAVIMVAVAVGITKLT